MAQLKSSVVKEGYRNNARGQKLFTVTYRPHVAQQAVYIHAHGYGEHVGGMHECEASNPRKYYLIPSRLLCPGYGSCLW